MNDKQKQLITDLANDFKPFIDEIEKGIKTTQNNYGRYMSIISGFSKGNKTVGQVIGLALIEAGANAKGVQSALGLCGY